MDNCNDARGLIFLKRGSCDRERDLQESDRLPGSETEEIGIIELSKVAAFNIDSLGERNSMNLQKSRASVDDHGQRR